MDIETKWLRDFVVLSKTLNFSQAAQLRHVTQPAFSRRIKSLEMALNCTLLSRVTQPMELTPQGHVFIKHARKVLNDIDKGISALNEVSHCKD